MTRKHYDASDDCHEHQQGCRRRRPAQPRAALLQDMEFLWQLWVAHLIRVKVHNRNAHPMLHFAFAEIVQEWSPMFVFPYIFGDAFGQKNVTGVAAVHHPLRQVEAGTGKVGLTVHIDHATDRAAMHSHSKLSAFFESATNFERAFHWLFRALVKTNAIPSPVGILIKRPALSAF